MKQTPRTKASRSTPMWRDKRGTAVIEMAIVLPVLLLLLFGIVTFGCWIALSHSVQQAANEGARAALSGLTVEERATLARTTASDMLSRSFSINPSKVAVTVQDDGSTLVVNVVYDAASNPLLLLPIVRAPGTQIERKSMMKLTGL